MACEDPAVEELERAGVYEEPLRVERGQMEADCSSIESKATRTEAFGW